MEESNEVLHELEYASIPQRFFAFIIDILIVSFIAILCALFIKKGLFEQLYVLYQLVMHNSKYASSIGENIVKIHQVYLNKTERKKIFATRYILSFLPIFAIEIVYTITTITPSIANRNIAIASIIFVAAWFIPMFFSKEHAALHDRLSKTRMIKNKPLK